MDWKKVCKLDDIISNSGVAALLNGKQIAIFRLDDKVYALDNFDPFSEANVISRGIVGDLNGRYVVASPIYKQHFDLLDGQCLENKEIKLNTYQTRLTGSDIEVLVS